MGKDLCADLGKILGTMARLYHREGHERELQILTYGEASIEQTDYDNWNGGTCGYTIRLEIPDTIYFELGDDIEKIEQALEKKANQIARSYDNQWIQAVTLSTQFSVSDDWQEKARAYLSGKGISNQGRARSDNVAPLMCDGLLFRSKAEIHLYRALKSLGVTFAPLPVFIRGGDTYRRIEPDFVLIRDGLMMIVEVDGEAIHQESPLEAHTRTKLMVREGVHLERVGAKECETAEAAKVCAARLLEIMKKLRANK